MRTGVALLHLFCLGCAGHKGCTGDSPAADQPLLTPADDDQDPCSDFAKFACGTNGQPVGRLQEASARTRHDRLCDQRDFLDRVAAGSYQDGRPTTTLLRELYTRCTDAGARDRGLAELRAQIDRVSRIETVPELARTLGALGRDGIVRTLIRLQLYRAPDAPDAPYAARVALGDRELPSKAYADGGRLLPAVRKHWEAIATLVGGIDPSEIDGALRVDRWLPAEEDRYDPYDPTFRLEPVASRSTLDRARFPWRAYLSGLGLPADAPIHPATSGTLASIDALVRLPLADLRSYLKLQVLEASASYIGMKVLDEETHFHYEVVEDEAHVTVNPSLMCAFMLSRAYGSMLDEAFLASLPVVAEEPARALFGSLRDRFARMIDGATWLDAPTRRTTAAKVSRIALRFAPDADPGLNGVALRTGSLLDLVWSIEAHRASVYLAQIGKSAPRASYSHGDSGGAYSPLLNSVWLSTAYARDPWIQPRPFTAANFGSLGTVMGHEIAHALSGRGRAFDEGGLKRETWSNDAIAALQARTACLQTHLAALDVGARWKVDARRTLDDDVAELVGVQIALAAMEADGDPNDIRARDSRRRDFFLAYAQLQCGTWSGHGLHTNADDRHSPPARILSSVLANVPEFAETFHCAAGTRMAPRERCAIW